jgi:hypothetical protein
MPKTINKGMRHCEKKNGKIKFGNNLNRGYCGYFKGNFLRSTLEYIFAEYLEFRKMKYQVEKTSYLINGKTYKPDFFIYNTNGLRCIVEIKYSASDAKEYLKKHKDYFKKLGIYYLVLNKTFLKDIKKDLNLKEKVQVWISNSIKQYSKIGYCGEENPHFGVKETKAVREKIGRKTKERMLDPKWKKYHQKRCKKLAKNKTNDIVWYNKVKQSKIDTMVKLGKLAYAEKVFESFKEMDSILDTLRASNKIGKFQGVNKKTMEKYFGNFKTFKGVVINEN